MPEYLILEITPDCNFQCKMCYNIWKSKETQKTQSLTLKEQLDVINICSKYVKNIIFTGGEPLKNKNIFKLIDFSKEKGLRTTMITNGSLLTKEILEKLKISGLNNIQISFHNRDIELFNKITGTVNNYPKVKNMIIESLKILGKRNVFINIVPNNGDNEDIYKTCMGLYGIGVYNIVIGIPVYTGAAVVNKLVFDTQDIIKLYKGLVTLNNQIKINLILGTSLPHCLLSHRKKESVKLSSGCSIGTSTVAVGYDGNLRPCIEFPMQLGNILNNNFIDIWESEMMNKFRNNLIVPNICKKCKLLKDCKGGCRISALNYSKKLDGPDPYMKNQD